MEEVIGDELSKSSALMTKRDGNCAYLSIVSSALPFFRYLNAFVR